MSDLLIEASNPTMDSLFQAAAGKAFDTAMDRMKGNKPGEYSYSSIAKAASKLIAVFPVLTSRTVSAETAQMASKYIEQISCQFIMLALQQANIDTAESGIEYLRKFHQNMNIGGNGVDAVIGAMDSWIKAAHHESASTLSGAMLNELARQDLDYDSLLESDTDLEIGSMDMKGIMEAMKANENLKFYDTQLNPISINDYSVNESYNGSYYVSIKPFVLSEASNFNPDNNPKHLRGKYWAEYQRRANSSEGTSVFGPIEDARERIYNELLAQQKADEDEENYRRSRTEYRTSRRDRREERAYKKEERANKREDREYQQAERTRQERERRDADFARERSGRNITVLKDQEIKKMNDAVPSLLVVKFYHRDATGNVSTVPTEFVVGVKSKIIPVTTEEVLRRIMNDNKDGKKFVTFMRAITGELKASELIFGLSRIKDDVKSCKVKGAYGDTWNLLANRAAAAREQVKRGQRNDFSAISTLVISQYDADELFREENFDIADPKNAYHFMQSYNLMAFAICDDATESMRILFDNGTKHFDEISYRMLERETQDGTYKKLINLMAASK